MNNRADIVVKQLESPAFDGYYVVTDYFYNVFSINPFKKDDSRIPHILFHIFRLNSLMTILTTILATVEHPEPIKVSRDFILHTYAVSEFIMKIVRWILGVFGLREDHDVAQFLYAALVFLIAWGIGVVLQKVVVWGIHALGDRVPSAWYRHLRALHCFSKICRIIPPIVFLILIEFTMTGKLGHVLNIVTVIYMIITMALALTSILEASWEHIDERENKRKLPLRGLVQLVKGIIWIITVIIILAILLDKSPEKLLAGLGAFAAVLMLIFKDSILGLVAGVQLSENDSLHVGDWIKVHGTDANGTVASVSLTTVKIINWDKTVTTVPPYTLVSGSFTNMRNMQESGTRRIQRCYFIDADSVLPLDDEMLDKLKDIPMLADFIDKRRELNAQGKRSEMEHPDLVDGTIETNLGLFRAYVQLYMNANEDIDKNSTKFVTTLQQTPYGIPLQIYCFTTTSSWLPYEAIQAAMFEHLAVMMHRFGLYCYESPSGRDTFMDGYLPGRSIDDLLGIPYPLFSGPGVPVPPRPQSPQPGKSSASN